MRYCAKQPGFRHIRDAESSLEVLFTKLNGLTPVPVPMLLTPLGSGRDDRGRLRHETEMDIDKTYVHTHGQSEVGFAFCHLLGVTARKQDHSGS